MVVVVTVVVGVAGPVRVTVTMNVTVLVVVSVVVRDISASAFLTHIPLSPLPAYIPLPVPAVPGPPSSVSISAEAMYSSRPASIVTS